MARTTLNQLYKELQETKKLLAAERAECTLWRMRAWNHAPASEREEWTNKGKPDLLTCQVKANDKPHGFTADLYSGFPHKCYCGGGKHDAIHGG